jgi:hypothetical protein
MRSQQENLEHEFLLVFVNHKQRQCVLRLERSTPSRQRRSFLQKMRQTSLSILPALDTVRISLSWEKLTLGMGHGPIIPVVTLPFSPKTLFSLQELSVILSFFPTFSPQYKLKEEQCYWFCNVVLSTVHAVCEGVSIVEEKGFKQAGKFHKFSVQISTRMHKRFVNAYSIIWILGQSPQVDTLPSVSLTRETMDILVSTLSVESSETRARASCLSIIMAKAGTATKLISIIPSASPQLKPYILAALDAIIDESLLRGLEAANINVLTHFLSLSLSSNDKASNKKAASLLCMISGVLSSNLSSELPLDSQLPAFKATISCLNRNPQLITYDVLVRFFDILSPAAPTQTRTWAIVALTHLTKQLLKCNRIIQMIPAAPEAGNFLEELLRELASLLMDNDATVRGTALQRLTDLTNHSEFLPILRWVLLSTFQAIMHAAVRKIIPQILQLLKHDHTDVQVSGQNTMAKLAKHSEFRTIL